MKRIAEKIRSSLATLPDALGMLRAAIVRLSHAISGSRHSLRRATRDGARSGLATLTRRSPRLGAVMSDFAVGLKASRFWTLGLALAVATWPLTTVSPFSVGLDPSWAAMLHYAAVHGMNHGDEISQHVRPPRVSRHPEAVLPDNWRTGIRLHPAGSNRAGNHAPQGRPIELWLGVGNHVGWPHSGLDRRCDRCHGFDHRVRGCCRYRRSVLPQQRSLGHSLGGLVYNAFASNKVQYRPFRGCASADWCVVRLALPLEVRTMVLAVRRS